MHITTDDGQWVDETFERLARVVKDYSPQFELRWIPPDQRETNLERQSPYVVFDNASQTPIMFASGVESATDILERLFDMDNTKGDVLARMEARNAANKAMELAEQLDRAEERQEYMAFLIGTKKNYINLGGGRKVDDQLRPIL